LPSALLLAGLSLTALGLLQYFIFPDLTQLKWLGWDDHYYRLAGTIFDPGFTGILLVLTFFLCLHTKLDKTTKIFSLALTTLALFLTYSRASYLAFFAGLIIYGLKKIKLKKAVYIIFAFLFVLPFLPKPKGEGVNLLRTFSITRRFDSMKIGLTIFSQNPVTGVGFNLLRPAVNRYQLAESDWQTSHSAAGIDNSYIFILATMGIPGLIAFLWLLYSILNIKTNQLLIHTSFAAVSTHALFTNTFFYPFVMLWLWLLLGSSTENKSP